MNEIFSNSTMGNHTLYIGDCLLVDPDGYPYIDWIYNFMGECVHSPLEQSSFYVGMASIVLYLFGGIPQIIQNFMKGSADGLAPLTLIQWSIGDGSNLLGALLTGQLFTQILLGVYFVAVDVTLIGQFVGYKLRDFIRRRTSSSTSVNGEHSTATEGKEHFNDSTSSNVSPMDEHAHHEFEDDGHHFSTTKPIKMNSSWMVSLLIIILVCLVVVNNFQLLDHSPSNGLLHRGRKLLSIPEETRDHNSVEFPPQTPKAIIGYVIGCIATVSYLGSRIAQIIKNFSRGSTSGMNPILFMCSVSGNILYSLSIFLFSVDSSFLKYKIPWLCSSFGNMCLDTVILSQYTYYTFIKKVPPVEGVSSPNEKPEYSTKEKYSKV